jgi:hypothetical protein
MRKGGFLNILEIPHVTVITQSKNRRYNACALSDMADSCEELLLLAVMCDVISLPG